MREREGGGGDEGEKKRVRDTVELKEEREKRERERNKRRNNDPAMAASDQTDRFLRNISQSFPSCLPKTFPRELGSIMALNRMEQKAKVSERTMGHHGW